MKDGRFKDHLPGREWGISVLAELGDNGKHIVTDAIDNVVKKYGDFDIYACDKWTLNIDSYVTEKNKKMISEIYDLVESHNIKIAGVQDDK